MFYLNYFVSFLSPLLGIWLGRNNRISLWYIVLASFLSDAISLLLKKIGCPHALVSNLFLLVEFGLVCYYFKKSIWAHKFSITYWTVVGIMSIWFVFNTLDLYASTTNDKFALNYWGASFFCILYNFLSVAGLYKIMKQTQLIRLEKSPLFIACITYLIYASGAFFLFLFKQTALEESPKIFEIPWVFFFMPLNALKNILLAFCLKNVPKGVNIRTY